MTSTDRLVSIHADESFPTRVQAAINALITAGIIGKADAATVNTALAAKAPLASPAFTGTPTGITKAHVGLSNVDNTSDANKPVSTAQAAAISAAVSGLVNGAPGALDTLNELSAALGNDASFATTVTTALASKVNSSTYTAGLAGKADVATTVTDLPDTTVAGTTAQLAAGVTSNVAAGGVYTAPALDNPVTTPPKRFSVKASSAGGSTLTLPDSTGVSQNITLLPGEARTYRQKTTSGWGLESGIPLSQLDNRFLPITLPNVPAKALPIAGSALVANGVVNYGADTQRTFRIPFRVVTDCHSVQFEFANWYINASGVETVGPQNITCKVGLELPDASILPVTLSGADTFTVQPWATLRTDPVLFSKLLAGQQYYVRVNITVPVAATGYVWTHNGITRDVSGGGFATTDQSRSGTTWSGAGNQGYGPVRILGVPATSTPTRCFALVGNSIAVGSNDAWGGFSTQNVGAYELAMLSLGVPFVKVPRGGELITAFINSPLRQSMVQGCTDAIDQYVTNDAAGAVSLATIQTQKLANLARLKALGIKRVYWTTCEPRSTSTNNWRDTANQTPVAGFAAAGVRDSWNMWLRDGAPVDSTTLLPVATGTSSGAIRVGAPAHPVAGVLDVASVLEADQHSGKWAPGREVTDAAITTGTKILTSATANFTQADRGARVVINGSGAAGAAQSTNINTVTNSTTAVLAGNASTTVTGAIAALGLMTQDGVHPEGNGHTLVATYLTAALT